MSTEEIQEYMNRIRQIETHQKRRQSAQFGGLPVFRVQTKSDYLKEKQSWESLIIPEAVRRSIHVDRDFEQITGNIILWHPDGTHSEDSPEKLNDFDTLQEFVNLGIDDNKIGKVAVKVTCQKVTPIDKKANKWHKHSVTVTKLIEIDLSLSREMMELYERIINFPTVVNPMKNITYNTESPTPVSPEQQTYLNSSVLRSEFDYRQRDSLSPVRSPLLSPTSTGSRPSSYIFDNFEASDSNVSARPRSAVYSPTFLPRTEETAKPISPQYFARSGDSSFEEKKITSANTPRPTRIDVNHTTEEVEKEVRPFEVSEKTQFSENSETFAAVKVRRPFSGKKYRSSYKDIPDVIAGSQQVDNKRIDEKVVSDNYTSAIDSNIVQDGFGMTKTEHVKGQRKDKDGRLLEQTEQLSVHRKDKDGSEYQSSEYSHDSVQRSSEGGRLSDGHQLSQERSSFFTATNMRSDIYGGSTLFSPEEDDFIFGRSPTSPPRSPLFNKRDIPRPLRKRKGIHEQYIAASAPDISSQEPSRKSHYRRLPISPPPPDHTFTETYRSKSGSGSLISKLLKKDASSKKKSPDSTIHIKVGEEHSKSPAKIVQHYSVQETTSTREAYTSSKFPNARINEQSTIGTGRHHDLRWPPKIDIEDTSERPVESEVGANIERGAFVSNKQHDEERKYAQASVKERAHIFESKV